MWKYLWACGLTSYTKTWKFWNFCETSFLVFLKRSFLIQIEYICWFKRVIKKFNYFLIWYYDSHSWNFPSQMHEGLIEEGESEKVSSSLVTSLINFKMCKSQRLICSEFVMQKCKFLFQVHTMELFSNRFLKFRIK